MYQKWDAGASYVFFRPKKQKCQSLLRLIKRRRTFLNRPYAACIDHTSIYD
jgi:hypothetical protein